MTAPAPADDAATTVSPGVFTTTTVQLAPYRIQWLARLMYGNAFEIVVIAVIIANATALAILTYDGVAPGVAAVATAIDRAALVFYTIEVVLRVISYGTKPWMFFRNPWNVFDFLIVVLIPFLDGGTVIFRLVRLLRILRIFRFLPEARILMLSMIKSVAPLASLGVLIGFLMFIYAMAGVYLFGEASPERWGDIGTAMVTLTVMLTLENFPDSFLGGLEITPWALLYFLSYMFFIVFTVLNILIGIVITAMDQARDEVTADRAKEGLPTATGTIRLPHHEAPATDARAELGGLSAELDAVERAGRASPDHIRRIRDEIDRLKAAVQ
ncbi:ion transporter [Microcella sp.]|uniref:ion transporter n=1 Tax=Microcella sp. TaxID=1913979 RepID=UPI003F7038C5